MKIDRTISPLANIVLAQLLLKARRESLYPEKGFETGCVPTFRNKLLYDM